MALGSGRTFAAQLRGQLGVAQRAERVAAVQPEAHALDADAEAEGGRHLTRVELDLIHEGGRDDGTATTTVVRMAMRAM